MRRFNGATAFGIGLCALWTGGCEQILGLDKIETYADGSTQTTTDTTTTTTGTTTTTNSNGGAGGATTTSTGGATATTGTGGDLPTSCQKDPSWTAKQSGVVTIRPFGADADIQVYCDQQNMGGGWALVYSSVVDPQQGLTTSFWKIPKSEALSTKPPGATPSPNDNYYAGVLYNYGTEYRDDITDINVKTAYGVLHAYASGLNPTNMRFQGASKAADNMSDEIFKGVFAGGWSSFDFDGDDEAGKNDAIYWSNVTQHYAYSAVWGYNLGSDKDNILPGMDPPDFTDGGIGPHLSLSALGEINTALSQIGQPQLVTDGISGTATRVMHITRWARW